MGVGGYLGGKTVVNEHKNCVDSCDQAQDNTSSKNSIDRERTKLEKDRAQFEADKRKENERRLKEQEENERRSREQREREKAEKEQAALDKWNRDVEQASNDKENQNVVDDNPSPTGSPTYVHPVNPNVDPMNEDSQPHSQPRINPSRPISRPRLIKEGGFTDPGRPSVARGLR